MWRISKYSKCHSTLDNPNNSKWICCDQKNISVEIRDQLLLVSIETDNQWVNMERVELVKSRKINLVAVVKPILAAFRYIDGTLPKKFQLEFQSEKDCTDFTLMIEPFVGSLKRKPAKPLIVLDSPVDTRTTSEITPETRKVSLLEQISENPHLTLTCEKATQTSESNLGSIEWSPEQLSSIIATAEFQELVAEIEKMLFINY